MGEGGITVHLGLEDILRDSYPEEYQELKKNIGGDKTILVRDIYNYMMNPKKDDLNPEYTENQKDLMRFIEKKYKEESSPRFKYRANTGGVRWMDFNDKLSNYPDAFHREESGDNAEYVEFGKLEEINPNLANEHVYLEAHQEIIGGKSKIRKVY